METSKRKVFTRLLIALCSCLLLLSIPHKLFAEELWKPKTENEIGFVQKKVHIKSPDEETDLEVEIEVTPKGYKKQTIKDHIILKGFEEGNYILCVNIDQDVEDKNFDYMIQEWVLTPDNDLVGIKFQTKFDIENEPVDEYLMSIEYEDALEKKSGKMIPLTRFFYTVQYLWHKFGAVIIFVFLFVLRILFRRKRKKGQVRTNRKQPVRNKTQQSIQKSVGKVQPYSMKQQQLEQKKQANKQVKAVESTEYSSGQQDSGLMNRYRNEAQHSSSEQERQEALQKVLSSMKKIEPHSDGTYRDTTGGIPSLPRVLPRKTLPRMGHKTSYK